MTRARLLLLSPYAAVWAAGVLAPLLILIRLSLAARGGGVNEHQFDVLFYEPGTWSLASYASAFTDALYLRALLATVALAIVVTLFAVPLGYLAALGIRASPPRGKVLLATALLLPRFTNLLASVHALRLLLGQDGWAPVIAAEVILLTPYAALLIAATLEAIPRSLEETARGLGASAFGAFRHVTLPLSTPAVAAAATLTFIWATGAFLGPYLLGSPKQATIAVLVDRETNWDLNWPQAAALNLILVGLMALISFASARLRVRTP